MAGMSIEAGRQKKGSMGEVTSSVSSLGNSAAIVLVLDKVNFIVGQLRFLEVDSLTQSSTLVQLCLGGYAARSAAAISASLSFSSPSERQRLIFGHHSHPLAIVVDTLHAMEEKRLWSESHFSSTTEGESSDSGTESFLSIIVVVHRLVLKSVAIGLKVFPHLIGASNLLAHNFVRDAVNDFTFFSSRHLELEGQSPAGRGESFALRSEDRRLAVQHRVYYHQINLVVLVAARLAVLFERRSKCAEFDNRFEVCGNPPCSYMSSFVPIERIVFVRHLARHLAVLVATNHSDRTLLGDGIDHGVVLMFRFLVFTLLHAVVAIFCHAAASSQDNDVLV
ncbi:hypothetical protein KCU61_g308, partial [Aureobasidium melanogenum]